MITVEIGSSPADDNEDSAIAYRRQVVGRPAHPRLLCLSPRFRLTPQNRSAIMRNSRNIVEIEAEHGGTSSAEDGGGRFTAHDGRRGGGICQQQHVGDRA